MSRVEDLKALMDGTPLAVERVAAIWPGLTVMERATLLPSFLDPRGALGPYKNRLLDLALADDNAFIRYLAARHVYQPRDGSTPEEEARFAKVLTDPSPLVRCARTEFESMKWLNYKPEFFWGAAQAWRLAAVTGVQHHGEEFAKFLVYAAEHLLPEGKLSEWEMVEVTLQYLTWETVAKRLKDTEEYAVASSDGWADYSAGKSLSALWDVIPKLPQQVGFALLHHLPEAGGLSGGVGGDILGALDKYQQLVLLDREDIHLFYWRRELFEKSEDKDIRRAALGCSRFMLDDSVITAFVYQPGESKEESLRKFIELEILTDYYSGASMAQSSAIAKLIKEAPEEALGAKKYNEHYGDLLCDRRVKTLDRRTLEREFKDLQLLQMVWEFAPLQQEIQDRCPAIFRPFMVPGNPWESYLSMKKALADAPTYTQDGQKFRAAVMERLPRWDFGLSIPADLIADPVEEDLIADPAEEPQGDALLRILPLKLDALSNAIDRTRHLLWLLIAFVGLLLIFRR
jgi:hypothetical protein